MGNIIIKDATGSDKYLESLGVGTNSDPFRQVHYVVGYENGRLPFYQLADITGDGTGAINMNVNGSVTPVKFFVKPIPGQVIKVARLITSLRDTGSMDSGGWGSNGGVPLTNGLTLVWKRNGVDIPLTVNPIKSVYDLASYSYDLSHYNFGSGDEFITNRFTFTKAGQHLTLDGDLGDELQVFINDDLTYLVDQRVSVQGYQE